MPTSTSTFIQSLIGAIPAEEGAALMARAGELARIMSSTGSVEVGGIALTSEAIDDLCAQLLPPDQLQLFRESGTGQTEFVAPDGAGTFEVLAAATDGDRWIEVRRQSKALPPAPAEDALVAELLSRSFSIESKASTTAPPKAVSAPASAIAQAPIAAALPAAAPAEPAVAELEAIGEPAGGGHDLDVPANFQFANDKFDADDLSLPGGLLDEPLPSAPPAEPVRLSEPPPKTAKVAVKMPASPSLADRLSAYGRLSILLPAIIVLVVGVPGAGWFMWMRHATPPPVAVAPTIRPMLKARRLPIAFVHALVAPAAAAAFSAPNVSGPAPVEPPPVAAAAPTTHIATAPAPAASVARTPSAGFSIQVAAVRARDEADRMAAKLVQAGYPSYVVNGEGAASGFYRVRVGAFPDRQAAEDVAKRIELTEGTKPWIVKDSR